MNEKFKNLFSPIKIGNKTVKNRIEAAPAMFAFTHFEDVPPVFGFKPNTPKRSYRMLEEKAKGGAGIVVFGELSPSKFDKKFPFEPEVDFKTYSGKYFDIVKKTGNMIKGYGALALAELVAVGETKTDLHDGITPRGVVSKTMPDGTKVKAFTKEEIKEYIEDSVNFCKWFKKAGWDGVMIHAGHGWLPAQFLSPAFNTRNDEYGGSAENRARFTVEMVSAIRKELGKDFVIEVRVSGAERIPNGLVLDDTVDFCKRIESYIDLIHVSSGHYYKPGRSWEFTTAYAPHGVNVENAAEIKKNVSIPVTVVGGINSPEQAEKYIAEGKVDMISLGRQMFADPEFPNKAKNGLEHTIRKCLRCAKCYPGPVGEHPTEKSKGIFAAPLGSCTINPDMIWNASHQLLFPEEMPVPASSKSVLIIGGGCGGMQAAITAYDRGHKATLIEKENRLGGILNFTEHTNHKIDIKNFKDLLIREIGSRNIDVKLNTMATAELIKEINPEAMIIAVGSDDLVLPIKGIENALSALDTYENDFNNLGKSTIVLGGGLVGCEATCDYLDKGIETIIIEKQECLMPDVLGIYRTAVHDFIDKHNGKYLINATVLEIGKDYVIVNQDGELKTIKADTVVNALGRKAKKSLVEELKEAVSVPTWVVGDCVSARQIGDAIDEAWMAAMEIL